MGITDFIKNSILEQFDSTISVDMILVSLLVAFICSLFVILVYKKTFNGVVYNRSIVLTIILLSMVTSAIIRTINSNLALSLGMVGALSIVRFRTAVKDPNDTAYMFWAIVVGIMSGAGLYFICLIATLLIGLLYYIAFTFMLKPKNQYLLVVSYNKLVQDQVDEVLKGIAKKELKSKNTSASGIVELTYQLPYDKSVDSKVTVLQSINGIKNVSLVTYSNDFGL